MIVNPGDRTTPVFSAKGQVNGIMRQPIQRALMMGQAKHKAGGSKSAGNQAGGAKAAFSTIRPLHPTAQEEAAKAAAAAGNKPHAPHSQPLQLNPKAKSFTPPKPISQKPEKKAGSKEKDPKPSRSTSRNRKTSPTSKPHTPGKNREDQTNK